MPYFPCHWTSMTTVTSFYRCGSTAKRRNEKMSSKVSRNPSWARRGYKRCADFLREPCNFIRSLPACLFRVKLNRCLLRSFHNKEQPTWIILIFSSLKQTQRTMSSNAGFEVILLILLPNADTSNLVQEMARRARRRAISSLANVFTRSSNGIEQTGRNYLRSWDAWSSLFDWICRFSTWTRRLLRGRFDLYIDHSWLIFYFHLNTPPITRWADRNKMA